MKSVDFGGMGKLEGMIGSGINCKILEQRLDLGVVRLNGIIRLRS